MLTQPAAKRRQAIARTRPLRTIIVVGRPGQQLPESAFESLDYDIVVLEPLTRAYTQIKRVIPAMIIMCLSLDDHESYQLLSMLKLDRETASIPIRIHAALEQQEEPDPDAEHRQEAEELAIASLPMN